jgi:hypothetical protein
MESKKTVDQKVRRAAMYVGLRAVKSKAARSPDQQGGYRLVEERGNFVVAGEKFDLSAEDAITYCVQRSMTWRKKPLRSYP